MQKAKELFAQLQKGLKRSVGDRSYGTNTIPIVEIRGNIGPGTIEAVKRSTRRIPDRIDALAVLVNSREGNAGHAWVILQKLKLAASKRNVPLYTFGQDWCVGPGLMILSAGDKVRE